MTTHKQFSIYICSDSVGETADSVVRATIRQFDAESVSIKRFGHIKLEQEMVRILEEASKTKAFVVYTFVQPELRECMREESLRLGVRTVDIMGPMLQAFTDTFNDSPKRQPGLLHTLDEDYFRRVEAIEFAVKCDDGRDPKAMLQANIVLIGVSRTSKTPLSIYLAHKGYKVANLPLVPEVKLPKELFDIPGNRIVGLTMNADKIMKIRQERLKTVGLPYGSKYAALERINKELEYSFDLMKQLSCRIIDVSDKAIEETAAMIMDETEL